MRNKESFVVTVMLTTVVLASAACSDGTFGTGVVYTDSGVVKSDVAVAPADAGPVAEAAAPPDAPVTRDAGAPDMGTPDAAPAPETAPTWTQVYTQVIKARCQPCHTTSDGIGITIGRLDMTSQATAYANVVRAPARGTGCEGRGVRVTPGSPDQSVMYLKVSLDDPTPCGAKMPLGTAPLTKDQADMIEAWIMAGAPNN
jgi:hypothetical protein